MAAVIFVFYRVLLTAKSQMANKISIESRDYRLMVLRARRNACWFIQKRANIAPTMSATAGRLGRGSWHIRIQLLLRNIRRQLAVKQSSL